MEYQILFVSAAEIWVVSVSTVRSKLSLSSWQQTSIKPTSRCLPVEIKVYVFNNAWVQYCGWTYLKVFGILDSIPCHWDVSGNGDVDLVSGPGHTNMVCSIIATPDRLYSLGLDKSFRTIQAATNEFWLVLVNLQRKVEASTVMWMRVLAWEWS